MKRHWHPADQYRKDDPSPGAWSLSFDASVFHDGVHSYGTWAFVIVGLGGWSYPARGPAASEPASACRVEWEGLYFGLKTLDDVRGWRAISITGDHALVIGGLVGNISVRDSVCLGWQSECLDLLAKFRVPWSARKVSREINRHADALASGR